MSKDFSGVMGLFNTPLLLSQEGVEAVWGLIRHYLGADMTGTSLTEKAYPTNTSRPKQVKGNVAVIPVYGVISQRLDSFMSFFFGGASVEEITAQFRAALADPVVKAIVFDIASPGGEISGIFDLADEIYQARGQKPIYAVANEMAYSGAYAIASAADKIYLPRSGGVGSIGVIAMHMDQSGYDANIGLKYTPIYAGARKNDFSPHAALSPEALQVAQDHVNGMYDLFTETVARNRDMKAADVRKTEAGTYRGKKAVDNGLADSVMSMSQVMQKMMGTGGFNGGTGKGGKLMNLGEKLKALFEEAKEPAEKEALAGALKELGYAPAAGLEQAREQARLELTAGFEKEKLEARAAGILEENGRVKEIVQICVLARQEKLIEKFVTDKTTVEEARKLAMETLANETGRTQIRSTVGGISTGARNPLLEDAEARAKAAGIK